MKSTDWILNHDLSLMFDAGGRLWVFRPTTNTPGSQLVEARIDGTELVVTAAVPGIKPGDVDVQVHDDVLEIRGIAIATSTLACDVGLPLRAGMHTIETAYTDGVFEVRVPTRIAAQEPVAERTPVAV